MRGKIQMELIWNQDCIQHNSEGISCTFVHFVQSVSGMDTFSLSGAECNVIQRRRCHYTKLV